MTLCAEQTAEEDFERGSVRRALVSTSVTQRWLWLCVFITLCGCWRQARWKVSLPCQRPAGPSQGHRDVGSGPASGTMVGALPGTPSPEGSLCVGNVPFLMRVWYENHPAPCSLRGQGSGIAAGQGH